MTFKISEFKAELNSNGYLRPWEYQVVLAAPPALAGSQFVNQNQSVGSSNIQSMISLRSTQARTPAMQIDWLDIPRYGVGLKQGSPYNAHIKHTHFAFICDKAGNLYNFFHSWLNYIFAFSPLANAQGGPIANQNRANYILNYKDQYVTDVHINLFNPAGGQRNQTSSSSAIAMEFILFQAFPVTINEIPLDWEDTKSLVEMTVVLNYRDYAISTSNLGTGTLNTTLTSPPSTSIPTLTPLINA